MTTLDTSINSLNKTIARLKQELHQAHQEVSSLKAARSEEKVQREQAEQKLVESRQLLQLVMDTLPEAIFWKDQDSVYLGCNQNFATDAGVDHPDNIVGKTDYDLAWRREEADFFRACDRRVMTENRAELGIIEPQQQGDGKQAWLETNKAPLHNVNGQVIGILGTYQDITEIKQAKEQLETYNRALESKVEERTQEIRNKNTQLELLLTELQRTQGQIVQSEKMVALGQMVAGIAHEINNPVNFIYGNLPYVQEYIQNLLAFVRLFQKCYARPSPEIKMGLEKLDMDYIQDDLPKALNSMKIGVDRIREIVLSLRNFSRLDEADFKSADIHEGIDNTLLLLQHRLQKQFQRPAIQVVRDYDILPLVECYPGQLNQVLMNILANAIDALEESNAGKTYDQIEQEPNKIVIRTARVESNWIEISISDNGPGMPAAVQKRIFDPFFTTKPVGKGTGLGMTICYQIIVEKHGGKLICNSEPENGTEFLIQIPVQH
ncbi:MAG: PAS domain-containing protein [Leptolyngbya sp. SIO3F4]|nr:PAS domain-containing protein [Leptolyngbya sp. SIO3F4]